MSKALMSRIKNLQGQLDAKEKQIEHWCRKANDLQVQLDARRPERRRLDPTRQAVTWKLKMPPASSAVQCPKCKHVYEEKRGPERMYVTLGFYENGEPGEMFIRADKAGSFEAGVLDAFAMAVSIAWQYGAPPDVILDKILGTRFEPSGLTGDKAHPQIASPLDYTARVIKKYLNGPSSTQDTPSGNIA